MSLTSTILLPRGELITHVLQTEKPVLRQIKGLVSLLQHRRAGILETPWGVRDLLRWRSLRSGTGLGVDSSGISKGTDNQF